MAMLDIFNNLAFNVVSLTDAINVKPNMYGRLNELNLFPAQGIRTRIAAIERRNGVLNLLPTVPTGGPATKNIRSTRNMVHVTVPHIPLEDSILAEQVQGVRAFGSENEFQAVQELVNEQLVSMGDKQDITLEYLRWGAVLGEILDADGSSILNLFGAFGVSQEVESFGLTNPATEVIGKVLALKRYMETHLFGDSMSGIKVFCSPGFFDALTTHANVKVAYQYFTTNQAQGGDYRSHFVYGGVDFEEQNGSATDKDGNVRRFIADNTAQAVPLGTQSMKTYFAPADFMETVNTPGVPKYAKQMVKDWNRGVDLHVQSNPLPIALRPQLLVKLTL